MSDDPRVNITENGPYEVGGLPLADYEGSPFGDQQTAYLCRCGGSANKPYCDGSHLSNGFDGTEVADHGPQAARRDAYVGDGVTIYDDRSVCAHAGRCTDGLASVWKLGIEPWIDPEGASATEIVDVIKECPSGALTYTLLENGNPVEAVSDPVLIPTPNGPYLVRGHVPVTSADGQNFENREHVTLCRCGHSENKPFCSGKHWEVDFQAGSGPAEPG